MDPLCRGRLFLNINLLCFSINNNTLTLANSCKIMIHNTVTIGCGLLGGGVGITLSWFSIISIIYISHYQVFNLCIILSSALSKTALGTQHTNNMSNPHFLRKPSCYCYRLLGINIGPNHWPNPHLVLGSLCLASLLFLHEQCVAAARDNPPFLATAQHRHVFLPPRPLTPLIAASYK